MDIVHMYAGTSGIAGLYMQKIFSTLGNKHSQECIVSFYYPFNHGKKILYKFSDIEHAARYGLKSDALRQVVRLLELIYALAFALLYGVMKRPKILNYSLNTNLSIELAFLAALKTFTKTKIFITCHDVVPLLKPHADRRHNMYLRKKFFELADVLLVHNENSIEDLTAYFSIPKDKIRLFPFPVMDMREIFHGEPESRLDGRPVTFLFIGHIRKEKGIDLLLQAWDRFYSTAKNARLIIAGRPTTSFRFDEKELSQKGIVLRIRYLVDQDYFELIRDCHFIVLPYLQGTNSGVLSTVAAMGKLALTSDIDMFKNSDFVLPSMRFKSGSAEALAEKFDYLCQLTAANKEVLERGARNRLNAYSARFESKIFKAFEAEPMS
jgi:glycosyltransferase involved in cell wall biosynthesis